MAKGTKPKNSGRPEKRKYTNPPIQEALCEFQFTPDGDLDPMLIVGKLHTEVAGEYSGGIRQQKLQTVTLVEMQAQFRDQLFRIQLTNSDGTRLLGVGKDVLSINVLRPYMGWDEDFKPRIEKALAAYRKVASPRNVRRIGVRYINRISIPQPKAEMAVYFSNSNREDDILKMNLLGFAKRLEYEVDDDSNVIVSHASIVPSDPMHTDFLLDIDAVWERSDPVALEDAIKVSSELHELEGRVFESFITDAARDLFDGPKI